MKVFEVHLGSESWIQINSIRIRNTAVSAAEKKPTGVEFFLAAGENFYYFTFIQFLIELFNKLSKGSRPKKAQPSNTDC